MTEEQTPEMRRPATPSVLLPLPENNSAQNITEASQKDETKEIEGPEGVTDDEFYAFIEEFEKSKQTRTSTENPGSSC